MRLPIVPEFENLSRCQETESNRHSRRRVVYSHLGSPMPCPDFDQFPAEDSNLNRTIQSRASYLLDEPGVVNEGIFLGVPLCKVGAFDKVLG